MDQIIKDFQCHGKELSLNGGCGIKRDMIYVLKQVILATLWIWSEVGESKKENQKLSKPAKEEIERTQGVWSTLKRRENSKSAKFQ